MYSSKVFARSIQLNPITSYELGSGNAANWTKPIYQKKSFKSKNLLGFIPEVRKLIHQYNLPNIID